MSVEMALTVVMRMQSVLTLLGATLVPVSLDSLEMERVVMVSLMNCSEDIECMLTTTRLQ